MEQVKDIRIIFHKQYTQETEINSIKDALTKSWKDKNHKVPNFNLLESDSDKIGSISPIVVFIKDVSKLVKGKLGNSLVLYNVDSNNLNINEIDFSIVVNDSKIQKIDAELLKNNGLIDFDINQEIESTPTTNEEKETKQKEEKEKEKDDAQEEIEVSFSNDNQDKALSSCENIIKCFKIKNGISLSEDFLIDEFSIKFMNSKQIKNENLYNREEVNNHFFGFS